MSTDPDSLLLPEGIWDKDVASMPESSADWILPGFIARHNMTMLTSMWKAGKTTLLSHLLTRRHTGQPFLGHPVSPGKSVVISEEPRPLWADRCRRFDFGGKVCFFPQPFPCLPSPAQWRGLMRRVADLQENRGVDLLVIDSLAHFLHAENNAQCVLDLLMPVRELTKKGLAAVFMHHPRRHGAGVGIAGRGHGALHSEVDISIEMRHAAGNLNSRARRFFCLSRHADTPRNLLFELNADGSDYAVLPEMDDQGFTEHWQVVRMVLEDAPQKLTRNDILDEWPDDFPKPDSGTLWRWLDHAVTHDLAIVEGKGSKSDPLRYWLAEAEARWRAEPFYETLQKQARELNLPFKSLREHRRLLSEPG